MSTATQTTGEVKPDTAPTGAVGTPAATSGPPATSTAPAASTRDWESELKAEQKARAKTEKEFAALKSQFEETNGLFTKMKGLFSPETKDPAAEINALKSNADALRQKSDRLAIENAVYRAAVAAGAEDPDDHVDGVIRAGFRPDDNGRIDGDALAKHFAELKAKKSYMFKQPAAPAAKGPPGISATPPPAVKQPETIPPPANTGGGFAAWIPNNTGTQN